MPPVGYREQVRRALPGTMPELVAKANVTESTVKRWLKILREADECHIGDWKRCNGPGQIQPIHVEGPGPDAKCTLKPLTQAQYSKRYRAKAKKDGRYDLLKAKESARYYADKAKTRRDPMIAALFGPTPGAR